MSSPVPPKRGRAIGGGKTGTGTQPWRLDTGYFCDHEEEGELFALFWPTAAAETRILDKKVHDGVQESQNAIMLKKNRGWQPPERVWRMGKGRISIPIDARGHMENVRF